MVNIKLITVAFDSYTLLRLEKTSRPPTPIPLLQHLEPKADSDFMMVCGVDKREVCISAETYVYGGDPSTLSVVPAKTRMLVWSADIKVVLNPSSDLGRGLDKAMKKPVPEKSRFQLIYVSLPRFFKQLQQLKSVGYRLRTTNFRNWERMIRHVYSSS